MHAIREAVAGFDGESTLPCFLALPEPGIGRPLDLDALLRVLAEARTRTRAPVHLQLRPEWCVAAGRAGVFTVLEKACALLASGAQRVALVGGIDSLVDAETLDSLVEHERLLGPTQLDGIIPGEAGAFLLLSSRGYGGPSLAALATAHEPLPFVRASERISEAEGLTTVFRDLRSRIQGRVDTVVTGTSSEAYFGREFAHAYLRNVGLFPEPLAHELVSHALGDVGAAAGAVCLVQGASSLVAGRKALVHASSDGGLVGGAVLSGAY
ncbi:hypothetical protein [Nannocystis punicea]|uniref:3-oxoacyl-[acyl-carrier-protein] synthase-1 n=1 Tax=Nannocystis punicea TaxID=2995304 RepID=A0ABY7GVU8_9BACT|nr:hypothetical protein [Nannocystis poenicansa]WAS91094.1 hypothetical protein O0S08_33320 [Nannocystis poenicansa]